MNWDFPVFNALKEQIVLLRADLSDVVWLKNHWWIVLILFGARELIWAWAMLRGKK